MVNARVLVGRAAVGLIFLSTAALGAATTVSAVGAVTQYVYAPSPIAAATTLTSGAVKAVIVTAKDGTGAAVPGAKIYLSIHPTTAGGGGTAAVGATALTTSPKGFVANASGQVTVTYTAGPGTGGKDYLRAQNSISTPTISVKDQYCYFAGSYSMKPRPIAAAGSLAAGASVTGGSVTVLNAAKAAMPGARVYLSITQAVGGGSISVGATALTATPTLFTANASGQVAYTYTAPSTLPKTGTDALVVQDAPKDDCVHNKDYYAFGVPASYAFAPSPIAANASLGAGVAKSVTLTVKDASLAAVAGAKVYLTFAGPGTATIGSLVLGAAPKSTYTDSTGKLIITFKTPAPLPAHGSVGRITATNAASGATLTAGDAYTY